MRAGVEHLLRDVKDASVSTLAAEVGTLAAGLAGLKSRLLQVQEYLALVTGGRLPVNHDILYQLQARAHGPPLQGSSRIGRVHVTPCRRLGPAPGDALLSAAFHMRVPCP